MDLLVPLDRVCCLDCLKGFAKSVQVLFNGIEEILVLTLRYHMPSTIYHIPYILSTVCYLLYGIH